MICNQCGAWIDEPFVLTESRNQHVLVTCQRCAFANQIRRYPLWFIGGSSASGKTTLAPLLRERLPEAVVFENDALHFWLFADQTGYASLHNQWLLVAREIALNDRPVIFLGPATPDQLEYCPSRAYFDRVYYLGLVCDPDAQAMRLRARPAWRQSAHPAFIEASLGFSSCLRDLVETDPNRLALLDTTSQSPEDTADRVAAWFRRTTA